MSRKIVKYSLIRVPAVAAFNLMLFLVAMEGCGSLFGETFSKKDLIDNLKDRQQLILAVRDYFNSIVPKNKQVEVEFASDTKLGRFDMTDLDSITGEAKRPGFRNWDLDINDHIVDSISRLLHRNEETWRTIKEKLDAANCISVCNGVPCKVGFQRSGMGMFFYNIFPAPISDSVKNYYKDFCTHYYYSPTVILEYGGGAVGPQCFPKD